jgi:malonyl-CoA O-methyltransferase
LAVKYYLDAARLRVLAAFDTVGQDLPATIDPADGRVQTAADWMRQLPASARVADVGCGKGRFLKHLAAWFPGVELIGVDISKAMLAQLPPGVRAVEGSLLRIPLADGELDGALAVESLEHSLLPEQAVAELCRVVRPGGSVLLIDKHRAKQPLSLCDPWERWCTPQELSAWLGRWCDEVAVSSIAHLEGRPGRDLFLAARGRRQGNKKWQKQKLQPSVDPRD